MAGGTVHISATKFTGNAADGGNGGNSDIEAGLGGVSQGGGVFVDSGAVGIIDSTLTGNVVNPSSSGYGPSGGSTPLGEGPNLFVEGGTVDTSGSTIGHKSKVGIVSPGSAAFTLDVSGSGIYTSADPTYTYGLPTDTPIAGDWTGNGFTDIGVVRPTASGELEWILNTSGTGSYNSGDTVYYFGDNGDIPVVGDWNGAGKTEIGVVRPTASGELEWVLNSTGTGSYNSGDTVYFFGVKGDTPVVGNWNGAGKSEIGVVRPGSNGRLTGRWIPTATASSTRAIRSTSTGRPRTVL